MAPRPLATVKQIAEHYDVSEKTVYDWHYRKVCIGPFMFRAGRHLRARWEDIERHDAEQSGAAA